MIIETDVRGGIVKIRFAKEKTKSKKREGRESKEGPTCQRERKVDAPEEEQESTFVSFGDTVYTSIRPGTFARFNGATFATDRCPEKKHSFLRSK